VSGWVLKTKKSAALGLNLDFATSEPHLARYADTGSQQTEARNCGNASGESLGCIDCCSQRQHQAAPRWLLLIGLLLISRSTLTLHSHANECELKNWDDAMT
jgi:hypothetical protein